MFKTAFFEQNFTHFHKTILDGTKLYITNLYTTIQIATQFKTQTSPVNKEYRDKLTDNPKKQ